MSTEEKVRIEAAIKANFDEIAKRAENYRKTGNQQDFYYEVINNTRSGFEDRVRSSLMEGKTLEDSFKNMFPNPNPNETTE